MPGDLCTRGIVRQFSMNVHRASVNFCGLHLKYNGTRHGNVRESMGNGYAITATIGRHAA